MISYIDEKENIKNFLVRLLEGSSDVLGLLRNDPFPGHPPRYIRATVYDYHFTRHGARV